MSVVATQQKKCAQPRAHHFLIPPTPYPVTHAALPLVFPFFLHHSLYTPLSAPSVGLMASYDALDSGTSPYGSGDPYYNSSTGYITPPHPKKSLGKNNWIKFAVPVGILVIAGVVVAAVLATRHHGHNSSSSSNGSGDPAAASSAISAKNAVGVFPTATNSEFMVPVYPSTVRLA
jgi:hypothetical protein